MKRNTILKKIVDFILGFRTLPEVTLILTIILGMLVTYLVNTRPDIGFYYVAGISILASTFVFILYIIDKQSYIKRKSDKYGIKNYPYKTLYTQINWQIIDGKGKSANCNKKKGIVTLEPLSSVREYFWGSALPPVIDDIQVKKFKNSCLKTEGPRYYFFISFGKEYPPGSEIEYEYSRKIHNGFILENEYVETTIATETNYLELSINFPKERPFKEIVALHRHGEYAQATNLNSEGFKSIENEKGNGVIWKIERPIIRDTYLINFIW